MVQILCGNESFCIDKKIEKQKKLITELPEINISEFGDDYMAVDVMGAIIASPILSEKRLVLLKLREMKRADELKKIADAVPESTIFVLAVPAVDKRTSFYKAYKENIVSCEKLTEEDVVKFIAQKSAEYGIRATKDGAVELIRRVAYLEVEGVNLYAVDTAIKQLSMLKKDITEETVKSLLPESRTGKAYDLAKLLCAKNYGELISQSHYLLDNGESEIGLLSLIARVFRLAWRDKVHGKGKSGAPFHQYEMATVYSEEILSKEQELLNEAIGKLKSGQSKRLVFDLTILNAVRILES